MAHTGLATSPEEHDVLFYDIDHELVASVSEYVAAGLSAGETVVVIATGQHRAAIDDDLAEFGIDVTLARATGTYVDLDAAETLDSFMVDGTPDAHRFMVAIGGVLDTARAGGSAVRAFGEMVALLWDQGNVAGAIELESLWNDLAGLRQFSLLCAYPISALAAAELGDVHDVCRLHSAVQPPAGYGSRPPVGGEAGTEDRSGVFVAVPEAVAAARRFVTEALTSWGEDDLVWDGALIVSELATNAVIHGGSPFRASIARSANLVRIAVEDAGPGLPQSRSAPNDALDGRGVAIVEELSHRWGCDRLDAGKVFWAELEVAAVAETG